jgi:hypothetical protein
MQKSEAFCILSVWKSGGQSSISRYSSAGFFLTQSALQLQMWFVCSSAVREKSSSQCRAMLEALSIRRRYNPDFCSAHSAHSKGIFERGNYY